MRTLLSLSIVLGCLSAGAQVAPDLGAADPSASLNTARRLYERLAGIKAPVDSTIVKNMADLISAGNVGGAADLAIADPSFINVTVKQMALKMSTREENILAPFNDFTATFMGVVRDDLDARQLLTGNFYYSGPTTTAITGVRSGVLADIVQSNNHYADLGTKVPDISAVLVKQSPQQLDIGGALASNPDPAGLLTTRTFQAAHTVAGTNRRAVEFTFREFMCVGIAEWADTSAPDLRVGPDVERYPGGDNNKFLTSCKGCHTQMDAFRGAFAYWDSDGTKINFTGIAGNRTTANVAGKYARNNTVFRDGWRTTDNSWINNSNTGSNASTFGWRGTSISYGNGLASLGNMIANSSRFSQCMTKRAFEASCKSNFDLKVYLPTIQKYATQFEADGYNFKKLFRAVATSPECLGE